MNPSFSWLNAAQFLGTLNDNTLKLLIIFCLIGMNVASPSAVVSSVGAVFILPFLLFSNVGGAMADRFSKRDIIVGTRIGELVVMLLAFVAFLTASPVALYAVCFLMSTQSAILVPSKYGILPEIMPRERLAKANGILVAFTFLAIIIGSPMAAVISQLAGGDYRWPALFCVVVALLGTLSSLRIGRTHAAGADPARASLFAGRMLQTLRMLRQDSYLFLTVISSAYFLMVASFMQLNLIPYGMQVLRLSEQQSSYLFLLPAAGVGISSILVGKLSGRNIEFGLVPLGAAGLTVTCVLLSLVSDPSAMYALAFLSGISVGFFTVPLDTFLQVRSPKEQIGRILAASSVLGYTGVLAAAAIIYITADVLGLTAAQGFLAIGLLNLVLVVGAVVVLPDFLVRFLAVLLTRTFYRIARVGLENLPIEGGALLVGNHVTSVDALLISATQQRRIRFVMYRDIYERAVWLRPLFRLMHTIPISDKDPPRRLIESFRQARDELDTGHLVCIFAEGHLTRTGNIAPFKSGLERILKGTQHPIVPFYVGGGWGSIFSHCHGKPPSSLPARIPYPVTVMFGRPMPSTSSAADVHGAVCELACDWFALAKSRHRSLSHRFVRSARRRWFRPALSDTTGKRLTFGSTLVSAIALSSELRKICAGQTKVGLLFPASVGGALANVAATLAGKVPVNINFTSSPDAIASAVRQCEIKTIVTSRAFVQRLKDLPALEGTVFLEDILPRISAWTKVVSAMKAILAPCNVLVSRIQGASDDMATIVFSSGTTGEPKGVMLSHHNIVSNIEAFSMLFRMGRTDHLSAALPFFHSFGFTCTLWFPLLSGFPVTYHANPLEGEKIAEIVRQNRSTLLLATPTFLLAYIRRAKREDFTSLRYVVTGAEKLRQRVAESFESRFGIRPLEGYGVTEASPVVALNVPDVEAQDGMFHQGTKPGTIGQPIPGVIVKVVDPLTGNPLPAGKDGLLLVKGPNVMLGYLNKPEKTAEVLRDGWYDTGDIANIDSDGFITITDRASRFSKIGGEMVPHLAVEDAILKRITAEGAVVAVTSVPDERRGERLVVLYTDHAGTATDLQRIMSESNLPNLWRPRPEDYLRIESMPILGSGKLDLKTVRQIAMETLGGGSASRTP